MSARQSETTVLACVFDTDFAYQKFPACMSACGHDAWFRMSSVAFRLLLASRRSLLASTRPRAVAICFAGLSTSELPASLYQVINAVLCLPCILAQGQAPALPAAGGAVLRLAEGRSICCLRRRGEYLAPSLRSAAVQSGESRRVHCARRVR